MADYLIPLTRGQFAIVDEDDYATLSAFNWHAHWCAYTRSYYAARGKTVNGKYAKIRMHRQIFGFVPEDGNIVDHRNGDTIDNRRSNLRVTNRSGNNQNAKKRRDNTYGYKGVCWDKKLCKWRAQIQVNVKAVYLGHFLDKEAAYKAYCDAANKYHGEFSRVA